MLLCGQSFARTTRSRGAHPRVLGARRQGHRCSCRALTHPRTRASRLRRLEALSIVWGRNCAHAHHLEPAQPYAPGRKVSVEFTVLLLPSPPSGALPAWRRARMVCRPQLRYEASGRGIMESAEKGHSGTKSAVSYPQCSGAVLSPMTRRLFEARITGIEPMCARC